MAACAAYLLLANWQLRRWLHSQSEALGCSLEYGSATASIPGHFRVESARLSRCNHGRWSARVQKAAGQVALRTFIWGPVQPKHAELELDLLRFGGVSLDGTLRVVVDEAGGRLHAKGRADELAVRQDGRTLASSAEARLDVQLPLATGARQGSANFVLSSLASKPLSLAAEEPLTGSLRVGLDAQVPRLELREGRMGTVPFLLRGEPVKATLQLDEVTVSPAGTSANGRLRLQGQDAHVLLEALQAPESLRFALSGLEGAPFTFSANVDHTSGKWTFQDIELAAEGASVTGVVWFEGMNRAGKLRVVYRGVAMSVQFSNEQGNVIFELPESGARAPH